MNPIFASIIPSQNHLILTGTLLSTPYKLLIQKTTLKGENIWRKTFGADGVDYEGQNLLKTNDGYLICGCSEGHASDTGGSDWKAYLLKTDENGNKLWDKSYRIRGNECAYSLLEDEGIILFGGTKGSEKASLFVMKTDVKGEKVWLNTFGEGNGEIPGGI